MYTYVCMYMCECVCIYNLCFSNLVSQRGVNVYKRLKHNGGTVLLVVLNLYV
jgi:hypothetical protein